MSFADRSEPFTRAIARRSSTLETSSVGDEKPIGSSVIETRLKRPFRILVSYKYYY
jgi:putative component of toxin-antitoxin plasmid stabilization module